MKAILLVGHGSRDFEGNEQVRQFIKLLEPNLKEYIVETSFLEFEQPNVSKGIDRCLDRGALELTIIPIMLLQAGHSKIHIPAEIDRGKEKYPHVQFTYSRPIGIHEAVLQICIDRLKESGENVDLPSKDTAIILLGRGGSDQDANSDLYKIARLLWENVQYEFVEPAFMGVTTPLLDEVVNRCWKLEAKKIIILPYFLFTGILIKRLERSISTFQSQYPTIQFKLANYFGFHEKLQTIILDRIEEALQGNVKMNCDTCQYRLHAMEHHHHHHHHDHEHGHHQDHEHCHHHQDVHK